MPPEQGTEWLSKRLKGEGAPILIDGGMGTQLEKSGVSMNGACWSGLAVIEAPKAVRQVHADFICAGAEVIITNTFAAGRHMLEPAGANDHVESINLNAARLAREAVEEAAQGPVAIAGSICEWAAVQDDPKWSRPEAVGEALHEQAALLAEGGVDIIAIEMAQNTELSKRALDAALATGLPVWLGLSSRRHQTSERLTTFDDASENFDAHARAVLGHIGPGDNVALVNIMHTPVPDVSESLDITAKYWSGPFGVYPESGFFKMPNWQFVDVISPDELVQAIRPWRAAHNIRLLGGCCGLGPEHVRALRENIT